MAKTTVHAAKTQTPRMPEDNGSGAAVVARSDAVSVNSAASRALYAARVPIYPKLVHGKFRAAKWIFLILALGIYYLLPFVRWPRPGEAPDQAVLVDFAHQRLYFFFLEIWPQEFYFVSGLLILAALGLFLVTSLFGRVWCGYACPQTVWTDLYIAVERLIEGDRNKRIRLDKLPWTAEKLAKKLSKHAVWLLIAAATGGAWIFYFHDAPTALPALFQGRAPTSAYVFLGLLTATTYFLAGHMREQVCIYMCPWPRIQGALTDEYALNVMYRHDRGEPRGPHKKGDSWEGRGHCIDCNQCVAACPMGIDIRDGTQLECIHCALCIDACDEVMHKVGLPAGLIGYDTDRNIAARKAGRKLPLRLIRPRTILYAMLILAVSGLMLAGLATRAPFVLTVEKDRNPPLVRLSDGGVRNGYTLRIVNKGAYDAQFRIAVAPERPFALKIVSAGAGGTDGILVRADEVLPVRLFLTLPAGAGIETSSVPVTFEVEEIASGTRITKANLFLTGGAE